MTDYPPVNVAWANVMEEVRSVGKGDYNEDQGFRFRGLDSVVNAVGPALRAHKLSVVPKRILSVNTTEYETRRGTRMVNKEITVEWEVRGPAGDSFTGEAVGEAADAGDKAVSKAQSVSYRVFLLQALCIPTGDADPDSESHERATAVVSKPAKTDADVARDELLCKATELGWQPQNLNARFQSDYGMDIRLAQAHVIRGFMSALVAEAKAEDEGGRS